jgi:hypothetical protein
VKSTNCEAPHYATFPAFCYFLCLRSKYSPRHYVLKHPQSTRVVPRVRLHMFVPYTVEDGIRCQQWCVSSKNMYIYWSGTLALLVFLQSTVTNWLSVTLFCQCAVTEFLVKEKQLRCRHEWLHCVNGDACMDTSSARKWVKHFTDGSRH